MKLPSIEKRVGWLMEAIDKNLPTELPKTAMPRPGVRSSSSARAI